MTTLRERIEARRAALLAERAIAEAATPGPWEVSNRWADDSLIEAVGPEYMTIYDEGGHGRADALHIAAQDPATTIARVDRELAGIDADLALLAFIDGPVVFGARFVEVRANLNARYPEEGSA